MPATQPTVYSVRVFVGNVRSRSSPAVTILATATLIERKLEWEAKFVLMTTPPVTFTHTFTKHLGMVGVGLYQGTVRHSRGDLKFTFKPFGDELNGEYVTPNDSGLIEMRAV